MKILGWAGGLLERLAEGTRPSRVLEGILVLSLMSFAALFTFLNVLPFQLSSPLQGLLSLYGSYHLRRCRILYEDYLWAAEALGPVEGRSLYITIIWGVRTVEILLIPTGVLLFLASLAKTSSLALLAPPLLFGLTSFIGHFTRVRLYRIFIRRVRLGS